MADDPRGSFPNPPRPWDCFTDPDTGYPYYYNNDTGESIWEHASASTPSADPEVSAEEEERARRYAESRQESYAGLVRRPTADKGYGQYADPGVAAAAAAAAEPSGRYEGIPSRYSGHYAQSSASSPTSARAEEEGEGGGLSSSGTISHAMSKDLERESLIAHAKLTDLGKALGRLLGKLEAGGGAGKGAGGGAGGGSVVPVAVGDYISVRHTAGGGGREERGGRGSWEICRVLDMREDAHGECRVCVELQGAGEEGKNVLWESFESDNIGPFGYDGGGAGGGHTGPTQSRGRGGGGSGGGDAPCDAHMARSGGGGGVTTGPASSSLSSSASYLSSRQGGKEKKVSYSASRPDGPPRKGDGGGAILNIATGDYVDVYVPSSASATTSTAAPTTTPTATPTAKGTKFAAVARAGEGGSDDSPGTSGTSGTGGGTAGGDTSSRWVPARVVGRDRKTGAVTVVLMERGSSYVIFRGRSLTAESSDAAAYETEGGEGGEDGEGGSEGYSGEGYSGEGYSGGHAVASPSSPSSPPPSGGWENTLVIAAANVEAHIRPFGSESVPGGGVGAGGTGTGGYEGDVELPLHEVKFRELLASNNLSLHVVRGDGNCLFRAVSHQVYGVDPRDERHVALRNQCCDYMLAPDQRKHFEAFVEGDFDCYVANMRRQHVWGGNVELVALREVLDRPVQIHSSRATHCEPAKIDFGAVARSKTADLTRILQGEGAGGSEGTPRGGAGGTFDVDAYLLRYHVAPLRLAYVGQKKAVKKMRSGEMNESSPSKPCAISLNVLRANELEKLYSTSTSRVGVEN